MPEFFLELFCEEIPARMQAQAAQNLQAIVGRALDSLKPGPARLFHGPRRIAIALDIRAETEAQAIESRGPRVGAPDQAIDGFLRKSGARRDQLAVEGDYYMLRVQTPARSAAAVIGEKLPEPLAKLPWPKSMRWGGSGDFTWVRPLRRIVCLLDGTVVQIALGPVTSGNESEGHRFHAPGAFAVTSAAQWEGELERRYVIADAAKRRAKIAADLAAAAAARGLAVVEDPGLLDEVGGLVEWPVVLIGAIDAAFMDLPPEVRELSMKVNQRYFALRDAAGEPAPFFAFAANIAANDGGGAIIAGNERVLRARLADARHFWDLDRRTALEALLPKLDSIVFHAKLGTQGARARRIAGLAGHIAHVLGGDTVIAERAGLLCKADLVTGMVGEFPELQGVMGGYYAEDPAVAAAIRTHYAPKGPFDAVPAEIVPAAVALADKLDTLTGFFGIGEVPTGSGDPYALRRAALGVIRIILENDLRLDLHALCGGNAALFAFIIERLRVKLRGEGQRFDVLDAVFAVAADGDLVRLMKRVAAVAELLGTEDGTNLAAAFKRAANILRIEDAKDGPHLGVVDTALLQDAAERALAEALERSRHLINDSLAHEDYLGAMIGLASLRAPVDAFFDQVTVNAQMPELRRNRLGLLARFRDTVNQIADFSKLEA